MDTLSIILLIILTFSLTVNYIFLCNNKNTAIQLVNKMGIGYNLGNTFNCCDSFIGDTIQNNQIKLFGTILPTKRIINKIKKYGFKTIRFQVKYPDLNLESEKINSEWISGVKKVVDWIINSNMYYILSIHHNLEFWKTQDNSSKDDYVRFWKQIANEFIDYNEYLIFETMNEMDSYISLLDLNQAFIDTIRNSGKLNEERLLIIPGIYTEIEVYLTYQYDIPKDPFNKLAISLHYYFPSKSYFEYNLIKMEWHDKYNYSYFTSPVIDWGDDYDYKYLLDIMEDLKVAFINKGIPVLIGEASILVNFKKNLDSIRQFIYALFALTIEYKGIIPCLWDIHENIGGNMNYYNKETDKWNDEIIRDNLLKISRGKSIKSSDHYIMKNFEIDNSSESFLFFDISKRELTKITINTRLYGKIDRDFDFGITIFDTNENWIEIKMKKENGKKQYDGTTIFEINFEKGNIYDFLYIEVEWGFDYIIFYNATIEFKENYPYFNIESYKKAVLDEINK